MQSYTSSFVFRHSISARDIFLLDNWTRHVTAGAILIFICDSGMTWCWEGLTHSTEGIRSTASAANMSACPARALLSKSQFWAIILWTLCWYKNNNLLTAMHTCIFCYSAATLHKKFWGYLQSLSFWIRRVECFLPPHALDLNLFYIFSAYLQVNICCLLSAVTTALCITYCTSWNFL